LLVDQFTVSGYKIDLYIVRNIRDKACSFNTAGDLEFFAIRNDIGIERDVIRIEALHVDFDNNYTTSHQRLFGDSQMRLPWIDGCQDLSCFG